MRVAPAIAAAAFLVNFLSSTPLLAALGMGLGNASSAAFAGYVLAQFFEFRPSLPTLKDVLRFILIAATVAPMLAALVGVISLTMAHVKAWSGFGSPWRIWWIGDAMGVLVVTPFLLGRKNLIERSRGWHAFELILLSTSVAASSLLIFGPWLSVRDDVLALLVCPFVIWAAIRFGISGAALASLLITAIAVWGTAHGHGPFVNHPALRNAELLQMFIAITTLTGIILAAVINEREQIAKADALKQAKLINVEAEKEALEAEVLQRVHELDEKTKKLAQQARLLDLANDGIIVRDADSKISYWNEGAERLYGWTAAEALGRSTYDLLQTEFPIDASEILALDRWSGELNIVGKMGVRLLSKAVGRRSPTQMET